MTRPIKVRDPPSSPISPVVFTGTTDAKVVTTCSSASLVVDNNKTSSTYTTHKQNPSSWPSFTICPPYTHGSNESDQRPTCSTVMSKAATMPVKHHVTHSMPFQANLFSSNGITVGAPTQTHSNYIHKYIRVHIYIYIVALWYAREPFTTKLSHTSPREVCLHQFSPNFSFLILLQKTNHFFSPKNKNRITESTRKHALNMPSFTDNICGCRNPFSQATGKCSDSAVVVVRRG